MPKTLNNFKSDSLSDVVSVSQYLDGLNALLKAEKSRIVGEVCDLKEYPERSYMYFSVKDSRDGSTLKCFMWKRDYRICGIELCDGLEVIITAYPNVYKPNGGLTMQVETVELVGEGALKLAYEELKKKLEKEGLFSPERKREIPSYPHRIGVITSKSGAVINDFLTNIGKFGYEIIFVDSKVEGADATKDLFYALEILRKRELDVLVIMRGGGSLESFLPFNNEIFIRAVADFPVPVITGIGHDKDLPLVSFVSDKNVSTPTAVANLLNSSWKEALSQVKLSEEKIFSAFQGVLKDSRFILENSAVAMERRFGALFEAFKSSERALFQSAILIESRIKRLYEIIYEEGRELSRGFSLISVGVHDFLKQSEKVMEAGNPKRQLSLGYSIVRSKGKVLRSVKGVKTGEELDISVSDGTIASKVI